jgi:diguanylate cyclase (GGDEF)-like protein
MSMPAESASNLDPTSRTLSPWRITLVIVGIGLGGLLGMFVLLEQLSYSPLVETTIGSLFMLGLMTPAIYLILLRPMRRELRNQVETARILREIQAGLEDRVRERTAEIEQANRQVQQSLLALERTHRETSLISELLELLQACGTELESQRMMERFGSRLFPDEGGAIYLYRASRNQLELATGWGGEPTQVKWFPPEDCWALRRGREHVSVGGKHEVCCPHLLKADANPVNAICIPMMAHGETTGLLMLESRGTGISEETQRLAVLVAERIGLALSNLQLHEKLRNQAIRDPLTAMYNRRYFEETAARELLRAGESGASVGVIMIDVDHFKRFNDSYGHEAGDAVLQRVGQVLQSNTRVEDVICRYGGEEFVMLLPGLADDVIVARAQELREAIRDLNVRFHGETLAKITISCGVSVFPVQGRTCAELIDAADHALYRAKQAGRDRVEIAA